MAMYRHTNTGPKSLKVTERPMYGSKRIGSYTGQKELAVAPTITNYPYTQPMLAPLKRYELTDHLGNVATVVTGRLLDGAGAGSAKQAEVVSAQGYEAFGSLLPGRNYNSSGYSRGFNGQLKDDEVYGSTGTSYTAEFWQYDPRTGRRWNLDPVDQVSVSNYSAFLLNPIQMVDPNGNSATKWEDEQGNTIAENDDGCNDVLTVMDEGRASFDEALADVKSRGVFDTKGGTEDINRATGYFRVKTPGTTKCYADRATDQASAMISQLQQGMSGLGSGPLVPGSSAARLEGGLSGLSTGLQFTDLAATGSSLLREGLIGQRAYIGMNARLNLSGLGRFALSPRTLQGLGTFSRWAGAAQWVAAPLSISLDYQAMNRGAISQGMFTYRTSGTLLSLGTAVGVGAAYGGLYGAGAGLVVGTGFTVGETGYRLMERCAKEAANFERAVSNGWFPGGGSWTWYK